ncbi:hypothetical protein POTOM_001442 [Populus tomentosa]|uniref:EGF-like domain-containing protein n=1 Tax=Populus tomentosa TaxID=118781 RepID=A0A8X8DI09_POPTO|nr:hypothetical protein POTOM_001442 [Populus tomentosa]
MGTFKIHLLLFFLMAATVSSTLQGNSCSSTICVCVYIYIPDLFFPKEIRVICADCVESFICFGYGITCGLNVLIDYILTAVMLFSLLFMCTGDVCALINCGQGTCQASNASLLGFECECSSGWKKIEIGPLTFPSCVTPNCEFLSLTPICAQVLILDVAMELHLHLQLVNLHRSISQTTFCFAACNLVWCGDGTCVANGTGHICQCNEGSSNLLSETDLACFKQCKTLSFPP